MTGAILTMAALALLSAAIATIGNVAMARDFPNVNLDPDTELLLDPDLAMDYMRYRLTTNLFYHQSRLLWCLSGALLVFKLLLTT